MTDRPADSLLQDPVARREQYLAARDGGDNAAIEAAGRAAIAAADRDVEAQWRVAIRDAYLDLPDDATPVEVRDAEVEALRSLSFNARSAIRAMLTADTETPRERPVFRPVPSIEAKRPPPILSAGGERGAILSDGAVCVLAGEGGVGKSALAYGLAHDFAKLGTKSGPLCNGLFHAPNGGGDVLIAAYEDSEGIIAHNMGELSTKRGSKGEALKRVLVTDMTGWPLFGPGDRNGNAGLYNARPEPLDGFRVLADALKEHGPRLVIVDPALAAFAGNSNAAEAVREFLGALVALARNADTPFGILLLAHSRKSAREGDPDPFDPGQVGGSTHWTDTPRGVMTLTWKPLSWGGKPGDRVIAIPKANWGPQNIWADLLPVRSADGTYLAMDGRAVEGRANGNGKPIYWRIKSDTQPLGRADGIAAAHQLLTRRAAGRKGIRLNAEETDALRAVLAALSQDDATIGSGTRSANSATDFAGPPPR